jgi:hypothetical protein
MAFFVSRAFGRACGFTIGFMLYWIFAGKAALILRIHFLPASFFLVEFPCSLLLQ